MLPCMLQPCIQIPGLLFDRLWSRFGHLVPGQSLSECRRRLRNSAGFRRPLVAAILLRQPLFFQQFSMHVKVPHRARCPPYLLEQLQPTLRRIAKRRRSSPTRIPALRRCARGQGCRALPLSAACRCACRVPNLRWHPWHRLQGCASRSRSVVEDAPALR